MSDDLKRILESEFTAVSQQSSGDEFVILCPDCGDKEGKRYFNLSKCVTHCFRCGPPGATAADWLNQHGIEYTPDAVTGRRLSLLELERAFEALTKRRRSVLCLPEIKLPEGFTLIASEPDSAYTEFIVDMAKRKKLNREDFVDAGVGFTRKGDWEPYAIFPIKNIWGTVVYFQGRTYLDIPGQPTKRFPPKTRVGTGPSQCVYNIEATREPGVTGVVILESILNVLSLKRLFREEGISHLVPVAVLTCNVSRIQYWRIAACRNVKDVIILFDRDATPKAWKAAERFVSRFNVSVAEMPQTGTSNLDANDDPKAAWESIQEAIPYNWLSALEAELRFSNAKRP